MKSRQGLVIIFILIVSCQVLSGQRQKPKNKSWYDDKYLHFGFTLGLNTMDFNLKPSQEHYSIDSLYPDVSILVPGINIQIVTNARLSDHFDLRFLPGVSFGQRTIRYYKNQEIYDDRQSIESSFIEFPLLLKYKGDRLNNVRPYVIGGFNYRYDLAAKPEYDEEEPVYIRLKKPDLYYEAGAGLDFYLTFFKLSVELKMSNGFSNILAKDPSPGHQAYANAIEKLNSRIWVLSFHFE